MNDNFGTSPQLRQLELEMPEPDLVQIVFSLDADAGGIETERLWAMPLANGTFLLDNSPFHAYGVSYMDVVNVDSTLNGFEFASVASRGGHSTYLIRLPLGQSHAYFLEFWPRLGTLGCTYEGASDNPRLYSIDVAPSASVQNVYRILENLEEAGICDFEEGHYYRPNAPL
jgi:hypothetical protein